MFTNQISELKEMMGDIEGYIIATEDVLKAKKEELRDIKQALAGLERVQAKYEPKQELEEEIECEE